MEGVPQESHLFQLTTHVSALGLLDPTRTLTGAWFYWSDGTKMKRMCSKHSRWIWCEKKYGYTDKNLIPFCPVWWRNCNVVGLWGPGNLYRVQGIMDLWSTKEFKMGLECGWIFSDHRIKLLMWACPEECSQVFCPVFFILIQIWIWTLLLSLCMYNKTVCSTKLHRRN